MYVQGFFHHQLCDRLTAALVSDVFCVCVSQYAADAKDKQWLAERHHMRATGGKMVRKHFTDDVLELREESQL